MIAHIDVGLFSVDLFPAIEFVSDECQLAEDPTPEIKKEIADAAEAEEKRQRKAGQENDHENREDRAYPNDVKNSQE